MKVCYACGIEKPLEEFHSDKSRSDGRHNRCRACTAKYKRDNLDKNRKTKQAYNRAYRAKLQAYVDAAKDVPCADCGKRFPPYAMDFDHVSGDKERNIAKLVGARVSLERIKEEIAKCEVVDATCHRLRTHSRRLALINGGT